MKQILSFLLFILPALAFAQWPAAPNKIRLGNQTTGDGLIVRTDSIPDWTPADRNNAWLAFDTVANLLYFYEGGTWQEYASGGGVEKDSTLRGNGTLADPLRVNRDTFATRAEVAQALSDSVAARPTGTGTTNALAKWLSSTSLGNSLMSDDGARITAGGTAGLVLPTGTTAQRSGAPVAGEMRRNTTTGYAESYDGTTWRQEDFPSAANVDRLLRADGSNWIATSTNLLWNGARLRNYGSGYYAAATFGSINASTIGAPVLGINATSQDGYYAVGGGAGDSTRTRNGILHTSSNLYAGIVGIGTNDTHIRRISANIGVAAASSATTSNGTHIGLYANAYNRNPLTTNTSTMYGVYSSVGALHGNSSYTNAYGVYVVAENLSTIGGGADLWGVVVASSAAKSAFAGNTIIGGTGTPSNTLHVVGTARVTGSSTLPAASVTGRDSLGVFRDVTIGSGLTFTGGTLSATGAAAGVQYSDSLTTFVTPSQLSDSLAAIPTIYTADGALTGNRTITGGSFGLSVTRNSSGSALSATQSGAGRGLAVDATSGESASFGINPSSTNTIANIMSLNRSTTGTGADGIGSAILFTNEVNTNNNFSSGRLGFRFDNVASRKGAFVVEVSDSVTFVESIVSAATGQLSLPQYTTNSFIGTGWARLAVDASGVVVADTTTTGGGGVSGSGTTGTIPVWSGSTALGDSPLTVTGTDVTAGGTGFFRPPVGTTAQQPGTPTAGMLRYNSTNGAMEYYGAAAWEVPLKSGTVTGLGTAGRVFYADANGRAAADDVLYWDATNNRLGINIAVPIGALHQSLNGQNGIYFDSHSNTSTDRTVLTGRRSRGTAASPTAVTDNDLTFTFLNSVYSGTTWINAAAIDFDVNGTVTTSSVPVDIQFQTGATGTRTAKLLIRSDGMVQTTNGNFSRNAPVTKTGNFTVGIAENWLIVNNASANTTVTLPTASSWTGREIMLKNLSGTYTVISNASNVVPIDGTSAGTAILPATAGAWCTLVSDGTNWVIMQQ